jgi:phospholipid-binding lipoprotein MlaA
VNTFFGLGGLLDVATEMRLEKRKEDFGQTLGYWGVKPGPYVVLPLLGPSTLRDTLALPWTCRAMFRGNFQMRPLAML